MGVVEGWVGDDELGFHVLVGVVEKAALTVSAHVGTVDVANRQVHATQAVGSLVGLLTVDGDIVDASLMGLDKLFRLHEHAVGNVLEEDQPEHNVLVLGSIHILAQQVAPLTTLRDHCDK